jgi:hypothetical protein
MQHCRHAVAAAAAKQGRVASDLTRKTQQQSSLPRYCSFLCDAPMLLPAVEFRLKASPRLAAAVLQSYATTLSGRLLTCQGSPGPLLLAVSAFGCWLQKHRCPVAQLAGTSSAAHSCFVCLPSALLLFKSCTEAGVTARRTLQAREFTLELLQASKRPAVIGNNTTHLQSLQSLAASMPVPLPLR